MAVSLVNDFIRKTGLINRVGSTNNVEWFKGITFMDVFMSLMLPCLIFIIVSFILKKRYERYKLKINKVKINDFI